MILGVGDETWGVGGGEGGEGGPGLEGGEVEA